MKSSGLIEKKMSKTRSQLWFVMFVLSRWSQIQIGIEMRQLEGPSHSKISEK